MSSYAPAGRHRRSCLVVPAPPDDTEKASYAVRSLPYLTTALTISLVFVVLAQVLFEARNLEVAWPFACYPTFQWRVDAAIPDLVLEAVLADGTTALLPDGPGGGGRRTPDEWGMAWRLAGLYGDTPSSDRLRAYLAHATEKPGMQSGLKDAVAVRFYRAWYSVRPEDWRKAPVRAEPILEVPLPL